MMTPTTMLRRAICFLVAALWCSSGFAQTTLYHGACELDLRDSKGDVVLFLVGIGDWAEPVADADVMVSFYPSESPLATLYRRVLSTLFAQQKLPDDVTEERAPTGIRTVRSRVLAERLRRCSVRNDRSLLYRLPSKDQAVSGGPTLVQRRASAYVAGLWARHQNQDRFAFRFTDMSQATFVASILRELGCPRVMEETLTGLVPGGVVVRFTPTPELRTWLERVW